jgi:hypothetical protein
MVKQHVTVQDVIDFLNELTVLDRDMMLRLINARVRCNDDIACHESVQVGLYDIVTGKSTKDIETGEFRVGFLGIINGLLGTIDEEGSTKGWGPIMVVLDKNDEGETVVTRFDHTKILPKVEK